MKLIRGFAGRIAGAVFAVLMLIFVLTMAPWDKISTGTSVGKVNGRPIDARVYQREVQQVTEARQRQASQSLGLDDFESIRNDVWDQFVTNELLESEYQRRGISVTDDEIVDAIRNSPLPDFFRLPEFQTDGKFDLGKYQKWLGSSVAQQFLPSMEAQYRAELERAKLFRTVTADVFLSDAALWERYRDEHEAVKVDLAAIVPATAVPDALRPCARSSSVARPSPRWQSGSRRTPCPVTRAATWVSGPKAHSTPRSTPSRSPSSRTRSPSRC